MDFYLYEQTFELLFYLFTKMGIYDIINQCITSLLYKFFLSYKFIRIKYQKRVNLVVF